MSIFARLSGRWHTCLLLAGSAASTISAACLGDELQNRQLLETLPRDRRASLADNLTRFDRLPAAEQTAIRRLDMTIEETTPIDQERYRALLQNYHLWFQGLTSDQQNTLLAIPDLGERFEAARKIRLADASRAKRDGPRVANIRTGDFGLIGPYEIAFFLTIWDKLSPETRAEIEKKPPSKIRESLKAEARTLKIRPDQFPIDQENAYDLKLEKDDEFKPLIEQAVRRAEQVVRKGDAQKKAENIQKKAEHPFAEFLYFEDNRPKAVDPARLERFSEWCPEWFHAMTDSLSADDARDYLIILYRLMYKSPNEMPEPVKSSKAGPGATPKKSTPPKGNPSPNAPVF